MQDLALKRTEVLDDKDYVTKTLHQYTMYKLHFNSWMKT